MGDVKIAILAFVADFKDLFETCGVCEGTDVWGLAYLLSDNAKEIYETYIANGISTDFQAYDGLRQVAIKDIMKRVLIENVL